MKYCSFIENESIILLLVNIYCKSLVNDEKDTRFNCGDPLDRGDSALLKNWPEVWPIVIGQLKTALRANNNWKIMDRFLLNRM